MVSGRFRDDGRRIEDFTDHVIVVCPRCDEHADVRPFDPGDGVRRTAVAWLLPRRLVCGHCGLTRTRLKAAARFGRATDPYFDLPLALQARCAGHVIWAYNTDRPRCWRRCPDGSGQRRTGRRSARPCAA